jgi:hypothetical protein
MRCPTKKKTLRQFQRYGSKAFLATCITRAARRLRAHPLLVENISCLLEDQIAFDQLDNNKKKQVEKKRKGLWMQALRNLLLRAIESFYNA